MFAIVLASLTVISSYTRVIATIIHAMLLDGIRKKKKEGSNVHANKDPSKQQFGAFTEAYM